MLQQSWQEISPKQIFIERFNHEKKRRDLEVLSSTNIYNLV